VTGGDSMLVAVDLLRIPLLVYVSHDSMIFWYHV
jgi:hypothetical protein